MHNKASIEMVANGGSKSCDDILSVFNLAVVNSSFYNQKLQEYMKFLPGILTYSHQLVEAADIVADEALTLEAAQRSEPIFSKVATFSSSLPEGSTDCLINGLVQRAEALGEGVLQNEDLHEHELLVVVQRIVAEASILDSMSEKLPQLQGSLGVALVSCKNQQAYRDLMRAGAEVETKVQAGENHQSIATAVQAMAAAHKFDAPKSALPEPCLEQLRRASVELIGFLSAALLKTTLTESTLKECLEYGKTLSFMVDEGGEVDSSCCLLACLFEVKVLYSQFHDHTGVMSGMDIIKNNKVESLRLWSRLMLQATSSKAELEKRFPNHGCNQCFDHICKSGQEALKSALESVASVAQRNVEAPLTFVQCYCNGTPSGEKWIEKDKFNKTGFKDLMEIAKKTILTLDMTQLKNHCVDTDKAVADKYKVLSCFLLEAWRFYEEILQLQGSPCPIEGLQARVKQTILEANAVRILGLLFVAFTNQPTNVQKQRALVQPILQELRTLVGKDKEREMVPHYLWDKCQKVLNMQKAA
eukprot:6065865-Amphidinium_carterae.2